MELENCMLPTFACLTVGDGLSLVPIIALFTVMAPAASGVMPTVHAYTSTFAA